MTTTVIDLHDRRGHPDYDPELNPNVIYVSRRQWWGPGRLLDEHPLKNPHLVDKPCRARGCHGVLHTREEAIAAYGQRLLAHPELLALVPELRGRVLACWCAPELCHAHVLAVLAERPRTEYQMWLEEFAANPGLALPAA
ncbi:DUF4326 domain-containing protein [Streptomyces sp. ME08-AFT2]|uniref:DUF4326 domain-containing protein n=1 Tax=Streptomyces sp. ME08-AFT2 TaxID=3028683 RepID=UPI0029A154F6|nr:DUF4326 domain-containing protein [Streptomyces sp. ME08-AFT2]MDX3314560.1 DUF4326 domain-containing protein [Streptomyces sp. ME08-AFT2]